MDYTSSFPSPSEALLPAVRPENYGLPPEFIRLPKPGALCATTSLPRSSLLDVLENSNGRVKVIRPRKPGNARGIVLIHRQSLLDYLMSFSADA